MSSPKVFVCVLSGRFGVASYGTGIWYPAMIAWSFLVLCLLVPLGSSRTFAYRIEDRGRMIATHTAAAYSISRPSLWLTARAWAIQSAFSAWQIEA